MATDRENQSSKFGTFGGVFTPCTLTILGVIMFLRFGQVVGQAGIIYGLLIVLLAKSITTLTTLSLAAIATNTRVKGGGAYYLISRSLGVEFGGAIGVVFFLAQAISVAMYIIGFTEAVTGTFPGLSSHFMLIATVVNVATFLCVYVGAGWTIKVQYAILAVLVLAVGSFFLGAFQSFSFVHLQANLGPHFAEGANFFTMFALFFPAVTGIMAGANMSGDLKDPARSIPNGTLWAVAVTGVIYLLEAFCLGTSRSHEELIADNLIVEKISAIPVLITAGVLAATLSSALGSMMGAPRILQAFARDKILRPLNLFAAGSGASSEPRRATILTFAISQGCILLGDLNLIAPIITMFFMITYGTLNLATFYEGITKNPSYRPTFRYCHWSLSLLGTIACIGVMFLIDPIWAAVAMVLMAGLWWYISYQEISSRWGDIRWGLLFERTRNNLLKLEAELFHPKNWRPILLALTGSGWTRPHLPVFGHWLTSGHGILTLAHVVHGEVEDHAERQASYEKVLRQFIEREELQAFPAVVVAEFLSSGIEGLIQCHGLGGLRPNTVLLGWPASFSKMAVFGANLRLIAQLKRSILAARFLAIRESDSESGNAGPPPGPWDVPEGTIDVWWRGKQNGPLMLLLAHLLHQNTEWRNNPIRILRLVSNSAAQGEVLTHLQELLTSSRIDAQPVVVVGDEAGETIRRTSENAAIVMLGFEPPEEGQETKVVSNLEQLAGDLPRVLFVWSAGGMKLES